MKGVIYARYSSDAQREESIDAQIRENTAFAQRSGIEIVGTYIDPENISDNPEGILLESMFEGYAEYYSAELAVKITRGMVENALNAKYSGGTVSLGYVIDKNQDFQIDPVTAPAVVEMLQTYAAGATMQEIVDNMNALGIRSGRGNLITISGVTRMLHNRKYIGEYRFKDVVQPMPADDGGRKRHQPHRADSPLL